jgi:hypothetical protein
MTNAKTRSRDPATARRIGEYAAKRKVWPANTGTTMAELTKRVLVCQDARA